MTKDFTRYRIHTKIILVGDNMSNNTKKITSSSNSYIITAIAMILIGVLFCIFRSSMLSILFTIVGALLIVVGIIKLVNKDYAIGIVDMAVGIVVITCGWTILDITLLIIGICAVIYGIYLFASNINILKSAKGFALAKAIIVPLVVLLVGVLLIVSKWELSDAIFIVLGVLAVVDGVLMLVKK